MKKLILYIITGFLILTSCQDVVTIDVPNSSIGINIVGRVTDSADTYVTVSVTAGYFDQGQTPRIENATVFLYENGSRVSELLPDSLAGLYSTNFRGSIGNSYEIEVQIPAGNPNFEQSTWRSFPETMNRVLRFDSSNVRSLNRNTSPQVFTEGDYALVYFQEPLGKGDNYRFRLWENDSLVTNDITVFFDDVIDGEYFGGDVIPAFDYFGPFDNNGDSATLEVSSLTREYREYLELIAQLAFQVGSTFDPPPAPVTGNIYNVDNPQQSGYGYFTASAVDMITTRYTE